MLQRNEDMSLSNFPITQNMKMLCLKLSGLWLDYQYLFFHNYDFQDNYMSKEQNYFDQ